jgi:hypothetical protein
MNGEVLMNAQGSLTRSWLPNLQLAQIAEFLAESRTGTISRHSDWNLVSSRRSVAEGGSRSLRRFSGLVPMIPTEFPL